MRVGSDFTKHNCTSSITSACILTSDPNMLYQKTALHKPGLLDDVMRYDGDIIVARSPGFRGDDDSM